MRLKQFPVAKIGFARTSAFDSVALDADGLSWWGANFGQIANAAKGTTKVYQWKSLGAFLGHYDNLDQVVLGVTERGPGTATYPFKGFPTTAAELFGN